MLYCGNYISINFNVMNEYQRQVEEEAQRITDTSNATEKALKNVPQSAKTKKLRKPTSLTELIQTLPENQQKVVKIASEDLFMYGRSIIYTDKDGNTTNINPQKDIEL